VSRLLHLSDTHFGTEQPPVVEALVALASACRPDVVVFSGDITQRARRHQFDAAQRFCERLPPAPVLALPGNHDIPLYNLFARIFQPYAGYRRAFGPVLEPTLQAGDFLLVGVNTTRAARHKNGELSQAQVNEVEWRLAQGQPRQLRVVVTHQPVAVLRPDDEHDRLIGAPEALPVWSAAGADLALGGHIHLPYVLDLTEAERPTPRPMWCVQAGTAVSHRVRHGTRNSVNVIDWQPASPGASRCCRVERWDYDEATGRFATACEHRLLLG
jgi:3',5'-cyclic AMP phosphodiesterase CpdA